MYSTTGKTVLQAETGVRGPDFGKTFQKMELYKRQGVYISELLSLHPLYGRRAERMARCATDVVFGRTPGEEGARLVYANFCKDRLCPGCQWRRSLRVGQQMCEIMAYCAEREKIAFAFVTLTIPSIETAQLAAAIDDLNGALRRLLRRKRFRFIRGTYRGIEITRNTDIDSAAFGLWHPHIHMLWAVRPSYFHSRDYVSRDALENAWRDCLRAEGSDAADAPYRLQVDLRAVRSDEGDYAGAAAELCKYPLKSGDAVTGDIELDADTVIALAEFAAHRRFISLTGCLRDAHRELHLEDIDDPQTLCDDDDSALYFGFRWHPWRSGVWTYEPDISAVLSYMEVKRDRRASAMHRALRIAQEHGDTALVEQLREQLCGGGEHDADAL